MLDRERYHRYLCSPEWGQLRNRVLRRAQGRCERCGAPATAVHHLTYIRVYQERMDDLQAICEPCHEFSHGHRRDDPAAKPPPSPVGGAAIWVESMFRRRREWNHAHLRSLAHHAEIDAPTLDIALAGLPVRRVEDVNGDGVLVAHLVACTGWPTPMDDNSNGEPPTP
jgi:hypothetical protein